MSSLRSPHAIRPGIPIARPPVIRSALTALAVMIAVGLALSARHTAIPTRLPASPARYVPLIQYRGTGALPQTAVGAAGPGRSAMGRAEHSYGLVP